MKTGVKKGIYKYLCGSVKYFQVLVNSPLLFVLHIHLVTHRLYLFSLSFFLWERVVRLLSSQTAPLPRSRHSIAAPDGIIFWDCKPVKQISQTSYFLKWTFSGYLCLSVCMYVCIMYVLCMYVLCMYVCVYVCMYVRTYVRMYVCICMCVCMYMYIYIYIYIYVWIYVCIFTRPPNHLLSQIK